MARLKNSAIPTILLSDATPTMKTIKTNCPNCSGPLEIPDFDFDSLICAGCGTAYNVHRHEGVIGLRRQGLATQADTGAGSNAIGLLESRLAELGDFIEEAQAEIESIRSREQSSPLQLGCAFFGLVVTVIMAIAVFMLAGKSYVGGWLFYLAVSAVLLLGLARIRRKLPGRTQVATLRQQRLELENDLAQMEAERERLRRLRSALD